MDKLLKYILLIIVGIIVYNILFNIINTFSVGNTAWSIELLDDSKTYYFNRRVTENDIILSNTSVPGADNISTIKMITNFPQEMELNENESFVFNGNTYQFESFDDKWNHIARIRKNAGLVTNDGRYLSSGRVMDSEGNVTTIFGLEPPEQPQSLWQQFCSVIFNR